MESAEYKEHNESIVYKDPIEPIDLTTSDDFNSIQEIPVNAIPEKQNSKFYQDLRNLGTIVTGLFIGSMVGGLAGGGIEGLGFYKGACLGGAVGTISSGTAVMADEMHASSQNKTIALLSAGGVLAGTAGMLMTKHGVLAVSESVGAGFLSAMMAFCMADMEDKHISSIIAGASIAGAIAGASEATKVIAGAAIGGGVSILAKAVRVGYGNVSLLHARDGLLLGGFVGKIFEASGAMGDTVSLEIVEEASLAGAGLGAVVGSFYAEKLRQDKIAKMEEDESRLSSLRAGLSIGMAAAAGGYMTNLTFRYIVPLGALKFFH